MDNVRHDYVQDENSSRKALGSVMQDNDVE